MRKIILLLMLLFGVVRLCAAEGYVVIESNHGDIVKGAIIQTTMVIELTENESIVLISSKGRVTRLHGPYTGTLKVQSEKDNPGLLELLSELVSESKQSDFTPAYFRGSSSKEVADRPDLWGVDLRRSGKYCVRPDLPIYLWWPQAKTGTKITFSSSSESQKVEIKFPDRKSFAAWPEKLLIDHNATYTVQNNRLSQPTEFTIQILPDTIEGDIERIAWMFNHNCKKQAIKVLSDFVIQQY